MADIETDETSADPTKAPEAPWDKRFWIGLDLDGTLAKIISLRPPYPIGPIIPEMKERLDKWLSEGKTVKIFTGRTGFNDSFSRDILQGFKVRIYLPT